MKQLEHQEVKNQRHEKTIIVVLEDISSPENVGMIYRVGEAMGISELYLIGKTPVPPNRKISKTARNTEKTVQTTYFTTSKEAISVLKDADFFIGALEITDKSQFISSVNFKSIEKIAIIIGAETSGVNRHTLELTPRSWSIPMFGQNSSMNVVTALAVALHEMVRIT